ncbi:hypothetical protein QYM36_009714 [Artemia franciscana]|uniref:C3H1-type domain-containing protein n=1 Tax=Artemia franciscana TaxID=6661 RepID=A0AA88I245_ARTSF|nr:hypothetical protein QYM36_009714 [Artemia franciscana]
MNALAPYLLLDLSENPLKCWQLKQITESYSSQEGPKTYARILSDNAAVSSEPLRNEFEFPDEENLCPFMLMGSCRYENDCVYIHGEICDLCGIPCILPGNEQHKNKHIEYVSIKVILSVSNRPQYEDFYLHKPHQDVAQFLVMLAVG